MKIAWFGLLFVLASCRTTSDTSSSKIIGGEEYRGMPQVGMLLHQGVMHCTASLIAPQTLITAAHCLDPRLYKIENLVFAMGIDVASAETIPLASAKIHPGYNATTHSHDIATAELKAAPEAKAVKLFQGDVEGLKGQSLFLVGYGQSGEKGGGSGLKRSVWMRLVEINDGKLRFEEKGKSACSGDSGGPAFIQNPKGEFELVGVTSCGADECDSYGVYTRIDPYSAFLGLKAGSDPILKLETCGEFVGNWRCDGPLLSICENDCFAPEFTRKDCSLAEGGFCAKDSHTQRCLDASYLKRKLRFEKLTYRDGEFKVEPYKGLGIFIDKDLSSEIQSIYGSTDSLGEFDDYFQIGSHSLSLRNGDRSYAPFSKRSFTIETSGEAPILLGDSAVQIAAKADIKEGQSLYVTGPGPLFAEGSSALRMTLRNGMWIYEDALPKGMPFQILLAESTADRIARSEGRMQLNGDKQSIPNRTPRYNEWNRIEVVPVF